MVSQHILSLIDSGDTLQAIDELKIFLQSNTENDEAYYLLGMQYWKLGQHAEALNCYRRAVAINPESPAAHAIEIAENVFNFFNPDLLNP